MPVTTSIGKVPADAAALKSLETPNVSSATAGGETMPILMVSPKSQSVAFYDLTVAPPVLRNTRRASCGGTLWREHPPREERPVAFAEDWPP